MVASTAAVICRASRYGFFFTGAVLEYVAWLGVVSIAGAEPLVGQFGIFPSLPARFDLLGADRRMLAVGN
jgi:hypothetical protein